MHALDRALGTYLVPPTVARVLCERDFAGGAAPRFGELVGAAWCCTASGAASGCIRAAVSLALGAPPVPHAFNVVPGSPIVGDGSIAHLLDGSVRAAVAEACVP
jgi:hypothetical protein